MKKLFFLLMIFGITAQAQSINEEVALQLSKLPLECINKEFPNKTGHSSETAQDHILLPSELHPSFYGCFDWHSSVHGHWMLVKLLKTFPNIENRDEIIKVLDNSFKLEKIQKEAEYFEKYTTTKTFERTYGWAWTLKLDEELLSWDSDLGKRWHNSLQPLTATIEMLWIEFLPKQTYPNRTGVHPNSAFGLGFAIDWAKAAAKQDFLAALTNKSIDFYFEQKDAPAYLEPDGTDFFSPALETADLMRRILTQDQFEVWFDAYLSDRSIENLLKLPVISDRNDYQIVHLDGLSLSRAWCLKSIAKSLPANSPYKSRFNLKAESFLNATCHM